METYIEERAAAGTPCAPCMAAQHFCPAAGLLAEDGRDVPVCRECGVGEPCQQSLAVERMRTGYAEMEPEASHTPDPGRTLDAAQIAAIDDLPNVTRKASAVSDWTIKDSLSAENLRRGPRKFIRTRQPALPKARKPQPRLNVAPYTQQLSLMQARTYLWKLSKEKSAAATAAAIDSTRTTRAATAGPISTFRKAATGRSRWAAQGSLQQRRHRSSSR